VAEERAGHAEVEQPARGTTLVAQAQVHVGGGEVDRTHRFVLPAERARHARRTRTARPGGHEEVGQVHRAAPVAVARAVFVGHAGVADPVAGQRALPADARALARYRQGPAWPVRLHGLHLGRRAAGGEAAGQGQIGGARAVPQRIRRRAEGVRDVPVERLDAIVAVATAAQAVVLILAADAATAKLDVPAGSMV